jgi:hypothetical protein
VKCIRVDHRSFILDFSEEEAAWRASRNFNNSTYSMPKILPERRPSKAAEFGQHVLQRKKNLIVNFRRRRNRASKAWEKIAKIGPGPQRSYLAGVRDTWQKAMEIAQQL